MVLDGELPRQPQLLDAGLGVPGPRSKPHSTSQASVQRVHAFRPRQHVRMHRSDSVRSMAASSWFWGSHARRQINLEPMLGNQASSSGNSGVSIGL